MKNEFVAKQIESESSCRLKHLPVIRAPKDAVSPEGLLSYDLAVHGFRCERISGDLIR